MAQVAQTPEDVAEQHRLLRVTFYVGITVASLGGLGTCLAGIPADPYVSYTVVNDTDTPLLTWVLNQPCEVQVGRKQDYSDIKAVAPHDALNYGDISGNDQCIQVATVDRRLVMDMPYEDEALVIVRSPVTYLSDPLPDESDIPGPPWWEAFTKPGFRLLITYVALPMIIVGGAMAWWTQRRLRKYGIRV